MKTDETEKTHILDCLHCGNRVPMKNVAGYTEHVFDEVDGEKFMTHILVHNLFECPTCGSITYALQDDFGPDYKTAPVIAYPNTIVNYTNVPGKIKKAFQAAIKTKGIDTSICVISLGYVLEMICDDKGAEGSGLDQKVKSLIDKKILPGEMKNVCDVIRLSRNDATHEAIKFQLHDVESLIDYLATLINSFYSLPARVGKQMEKLMKRNESKRSDVPPPKRSI